MKITGCTVGNSLRVTASKASGSEYGVSGSSTLQDQVAWSSRNVSLSNGTGDNGANLLFHYTGTIAPSATLNLDLAGGTSATPPITDPFGVGAVFASLKSIQIANVADTNNCTLQVGAATTDPIASVFASTTDIAIVPNGGFLSLTGPKAGFAVTSGSADVLAITNANTANTATVEILILGVSA
jgi:hypothetical protein